MQSILLASKQSEKALEFVRKFARDNNVHEFDQTIIELETLGIDDVRNFQKKAYLKPFKSKQKIVYLRAGELTHESQNALLKILEEPPDNTVIILSVPDKNLVLPTIISRCKVFEIKNNGHLPKSEISKYQNVLLSLKSKGVGERLKLAQDYSKDREQALLFIKSLIHAGRANLLKYPNIEYLNTLKSLQRFYTIIKTTNVNLRLAVENLFLNL